ncbi:MAG TPA: phosphatase PAP2 family protein [Candidatus Saccharimonadales bacterium]|nr:phosphatase PAP2 family protein [Candidatus Saccharimonadales bacterium]
MELLDRLDANLGATIIRGLPRTQHRNMVIISFCGGPAIITIIGLGGLYWANYHGRLQIIKALLYSAVAFLIVTILKLILRRPRPNGMKIKNMKLPSYSFPSGHAFGPLLFFGLYTYIGSLYLSPVWSAVLAGILSALTFLIGLSRVYLGVHYPSDVLAGWVLGGLSLYIVISAAF